MQTIPKHIIWSIIDCSSMYATGITCIQGVDLRGIGECGHFRSHHSINNCRKPPAIRKLHGFIYFRTGIITD